MPDEKNKTDRAAWQCCDAPDHDAGNGSDHPKKLECCGAEMGGMMAACPCGFLMRKHPVVTSTILVAMGLVFLAVPAGAILGIIAFFRTL